MARRVIIRCQQCSKEAVVTEELNQVTAAKALEFMPPGGWRTVFLDLGGGSVTADMCSLKCGVTWARDRIVEAIQVAERLGQYIDED